MVISYWLMDFTLDVLLTINNSRLTDNLFPRFILKKLLKINKS